MNDSFNWNANEFSILSLCTFVLRAGCIAYLPTLQASFGFTLNYFIFSIISVGASIFIFHFQNPTFFDICLHILCGSILVICLSIMEVSADAKLTQ